MYVLIHVSAVFYEMQFYIFFVCLSTQLCEAKTGCMSYPLCVFMSWCAFVCSLDTSGDLLKAAMHLWSWAICHGWLIIHLLHFALFLSNHKGKSSNLLHRYIWERSNDSSDVYLQPISQMIEHGKTIHLLHLDQFLNDHKR